MGITSPLDGYPSEVIGGLRTAARTLEMADAYATLANGGTHIAPTIISKVVFPDGSSINLGDPPHKPVFSDGETYAATKVLKTVIQSGTGTAANYGCPAAGKTGTAEQLRQRLVRRLHAAALDRGLGRLSAGRTSRWPTASAARSRRRSGTTTWPQASNGFCGDFPPPTTYWTGTAFFGAALGEPRRRRASRQRLVEPVQQPDAVRAAGDSRAGAADRRTAHRAPTHDCRRQRRGQRQRRRRTAVERPPAAATATATAAARSRSTNLRRTCPRKRRSSSRERSSRRCRTRCSASSSTTWIAPCSATSRARCAASGSGSCPGDRVRVELSPYDLDRARIVYRHR